ncbi:MAG: YbhB/YbcL family Raf kinase inhibitor-like protein [Candidatus Eremiobacteraeota bacterium]|nr:YbhB/YbcL family Raf kinase inhibitor-like protein [Candidatus Eremiobacteraeota bacterium]
MRFSASFLRPVAAALFVCACSGPQIQNGVTNAPLTMNPNAAPPFTVRSATFKNNHFVPASMVYNRAGCSGGNESPELSWTGAPKKTKSFAVLTLDTTAIFWHWGMYDISPSTDELPENAGTKKSKYGTEVLNDWAIYLGKSNRGYDGPCPPPGKAHHYVFTVYALDTTLKLPRSAYVENLDLAIRGHILAAASVTGLYKK